MHDRGPGPHGASRLAVALSVLVITACGGAAPTASPGATPQGASAAPAAPTLSSPLASPSWLAVLPTTTPFPTVVATATPTLEPTPEPSEAPEPTEAPLPTATALQTPTARPTSGADLAISTVARAAADPTAARTAATSINAFGLDLFRQMLADPALALAGRNAVVSPTSIALALAMARAGAKGATAAQMDGVLHTAGWDTLGPGLNSLEQALASRDATWTEGDGEHELALRIANAAYGQRGWTIEQGYLDAIAGTFGAGLRLVDYIRDAEGARKAINAWVKTQTKGRIPQLIPAGAIDALTRLVLVNAIYLKAEWETPFSEQVTKPAAFVRPDGSTVEVPTMLTTSLGTEPFMPYASGNGWRATELRYRGADWTHPLAMTLVLPDDLAAFEARLTASQLTRIADALARQRDDPVMVPCPPSWPGWECYPYAIDLFLPRFGIDVHARLNDTLKALGMPLAFQPTGADFAGIHVPETQQDAIYISTVIHQATIDVDEKGTEAAAATMVGMSTAGPGAVAAKTITLRFDRPFLFFVRDLETGAVLFMGHVADPSAPKRS